MKYFKTLSNDKIKCILCRHYCQLKEGQTGICGVNKNNNGKLENLVYAHPSALNVDPVEKNGCNFTCPFCQNWGISQSKNIDKNVSIEPKEMVELAKKYKCNSIAYTYNEPTIFYPYAKDIGILAEEESIKNIFVSNGFESPEIIKDMSNWLDGANIDLKSWNEKYYKRVLKGGLEAVKDTLRLMIKQGIWVEITTLLIEGENDAQKDLEEMASFIADELGRFVPWHLSAFHPDYKMKDHDYTKVQTLQKAYNIAKEAGLYYVYLGNIAAEGKTYCPKCGELLIDRTNYDMTINKLKNGKCPKCDRKIEGIWK